MTIKKNEPIVLNNWWCNPINLNPFPYAVCDCGQLESTNLMIIIIASTEMSLCNCQCDHCRPIPIRSVYTVNSTAVSIQRWLAVCQRPSNQRGRKKKIELISSVSLTMSIARSTLFRRNNAKQLIQSGFFRKLKIRLIVYPRWEQMIEESAICNLSSVCQTRMDYYGNQFCLKRPNIIHTL